MGWNAEIASKAYIDTIKMISSFTDCFDESSVAEFVSAMAGGYKSQMILEYWFSGSGISISLGLSIASRHTGGRHVCIVPDEKSRTEYLEMMRKCGAKPEVIVEELEEEDEDEDEEKIGFREVDFILVDERRKNAGKILRLTRISPRGAVLACKNANPRFGSSKWRLAGEIRFVRSVFLPIGNGLEISRLSASGGSNRRHGRWIRQIDRETGEEHVFRR